MASVASPAVPGLLPGCASERHETYAAASDVGAQDGRHYADSLEERSCSHKPVCPSILNGYPVERRQGV